MERVRLDKHYLKIDNNVFDMNNIAVIEIGQEFDSNTGMYRLRIFQPNSNHEDIEGTHTWFEEHAQSNFNEIKKVLRDNPAFVSFEKSKIVNLSLVKDIQYCENLDKTYTKICFENLSFKCGKNYTEAFVKLRERFNEYIQNIMCFNKC